MIKSSLEIFADAMVAAGDIKAADVRKLQRDVLPDGIESRDEADLLIALDRAVSSKAGAWSAFVVSAVTEFVVWTSRPTGYVDRDTASWLVASLGAGRGPTPVAEAIAYEVVREGERTDEVLLAFVMRSAVGRLQELPPEERCLDVAA